LKYFLEYHWKGSWKSVEIGKEWNGETTEKQRRKNGKNNG
jgi:hypothetical protein